MSDQNFNQSIKHFCGGSQATGLFMEANYHGNNYTIPVNSSREPELLYGTSLENIMFAKNYNQSAKQNGMADNDVHNQYIDFIVRTALYHKELDNPTLVGSGLESTRNSLREGLQELLHEKIGNLVSIGNLSTLLDSRGWIFQSTPSAVPSGGQGQVNQISLRSIGITENSEFREYANAVIILMSLSESLLGAPPTDLSSLKNAPVLSPVKLSDRRGNEKTSKGATHINSFEYHLRKLLGDCDDTANLGTSITGNLCLVSKFNGTSASAAGNIMSILQKNGKTPADAQRVLAEMTNGMVEEMTRYSMALHRELGGLNAIHARFRDNYAQATQVVKDMLKQVNNNTGLLESLKDNLLSEIFKVVRSLINVQVDTSFVSVDRNSHATRLFENVFLNWQNLDREAREFYRAHLHIFRQVGNTRGQFNVLGSAQNGWEDIGDRVEDANFLRSLNRSEIRINLMKQRAGSADVLFGKTLPFLPVVGNKSVRSVWYTPASTTVPQSIPANNLTETFLQDLYACVYNGSACNFNGIVLNLPTSYSQVESLTQDFAIEDILVIKNFIAARKQTMAPQSVNASFDALFVEDMVSQVTWRLDEQGNLYRLENGNKIPYSPDEITIDNCVGTRLAGDRLQCSKLVRECLMSGDKNALNDCIGNLRAANMFNVAQSECQHVDPHVAVQILRTFGIGRVETKDPILGTINVPQPFEHWKKNTLSGLRPALQEAIINDNKLCDYLKGVIAFVTMNPAILNKNIPQNNTVTLSSQPIDDPYIKALNKTMYVNPYQTAQEQKLFTAQSLVKTVQFPQTAVTAPSQLTNPFNNITYGANNIGVPAYRSLSGGSASAYEESVMRKIKRNGSTAQLISTLMENLFEEMRNSGIPLNDVDRTRINDGVNKLAHGEKTLGKYYSMLRALTDLALFFKSSGCVQQHGELKELSLETIKSRADTLAYLYQNIGDVQNCISNGIDGQNSKCKELVDFYSVLVNDQNNNTVRVTNL